MSVIWLLAVTTQLAAGIDGSAAAADAGLAPAPMEAAVDAGAELDAGPAPQAAAAPQPETRPAPPDAGADQKLSAEQVNELMTLPLEDLLSMPVEVASKKASTVRETPGVVTVVTREEIINSGARDLIDVLLLVPGFSFPAVDVEGVRDMGVRGIWAHEGKVLLMVDGLAMNELLFDDNELGQHFPIQQIQRIEIIRGAGSAMYGEWAEVGVINIITQGAKDLRGVQASAGYGQMMHGLGFADLDLAVGQVAPGGIDGLSYSVSGYVGTSAMGDQTYSDFSGGSFKQSADTQGERPMFLNAALEYRGLKLRFLYDGYLLHEQDSYAAIDPQPATEYFPSLFGDASYELKIGKLTITPRFVYKRQRPWSVLDINTPEYFSTIGERFTAGLVGTYDFSDQLDLTLGVEGYLDRAWIADRAAADQLLASDPGTFLGSQSLFNNGQDSQTFSNVAALAELHWQIEVGDVHLGHLTAGGRFEHQSEFGDKAVPRVAFTKVAGDFHFKLLYSLAFRDPGFEDLALAPPDQKLLPETTRDGEVEVGYTIGGHAFLTANLFDITIENPIIYTTTDDGGQVYLNFPRTGSEGAELDLKLRYDWGYLDANYSYYTSSSVLAALTDLPHADKNQVPIYAVPGSSSLLWAFPSHKVAVNAHYRVWRGLSLNPSAVFVSERCGNVSGDGAGNPNYGCQPPRLLVNFFANYADLLTPGLDVGVGVYNLLDQRYGYLQAYNASHAPIPGPSFEALARVAYRFGL